MKSLSNGVAKELLAENYEFGLWCMGPCLKLIRQGIAYELNPSRVLCPDCYKTAFSKMEVTWGKNDD